LILLNNIKEEINMNLEEGLKKGLQIYAEGCLSSQYNMNMKDYTYELDFERNWVEFRMPHELHNSRWLWSSFYSDINEIKDFLNSYVKDNFGDFVKEAFLEAKNEKLYGADIYGKIQAEIIRAEKDGVEPLLTSDDYKAIIDLIKEHRQLVKENMSTTRQLNNRAWLNDCRP
jgi:hypothetical protein